MLKFLASHDMDTTRGKNGAFTRKRPGQASGSDRPRQQQQPQPHPQSLLRNPPPPNPPYDYQEAVPLPPTSRRSRPADYEEVVPIPHGTSKRSAPPPRPSQQRGLSNYPPQPPSRAPSQLSRRDTRGGGGANGSLRPSLQQQAPPRSRSGRDAGSAAIRRELGELSIHEPQQQGQGQGRSRRYEDDDESEDDCDEGYRHQGSVAPPRARVSFMEPPSGRSFREGSRYESRRSRR